MDQNELVDVARLAAEVEYLRKDLSVLEMKTTIHFWPIFSAVAPILIVLASSLIALLIQGVELRSAVKNISDANEKQNEALEAITKRLTTLDTSVDANKRLLEQHITSAEGRKS